MGYAQLNYYCHNLCSIQAHFNKLILTHYIYVYPGAKGRADDFFLDQYSIEQNGGPNDKFDDDKGNSAGDDEVRKDLRYF